MNSNLSYAVEQGELALARMPEHHNLPITTVIRQKSLLGAINLCIAESGLEDKEIYLTLGIDAGHFSKIRKGEAHFPTNKLNDLCDLCGNEAALQWWANSRGYALVMIKSEAERRADESEKRAAASDAENRILREIIRGRAT